MRYGRSVTCCADRSYPPVILAGLSPCLMNPKLREHISAWFAGTCKPPKPRNGHRSGNPKGEWFTVTFAKPGHDEKQEDANNYLMNPRSRRLALYGPDGVM